MSFVINPFIFAGLAGGGTWLLRATWNTAADQGYTNAQVLDTAGEGVEDGDLTVVEADGTLAVVGNKLSFTAQATPAFGDLGVFSNSITRAAGIGLLSRVEVTTEDKDLYPAVFSDAGDVGETNQIYRFKLDDDGRVFVSALDGAGNVLDGVIIPSYYFTRTDYEFLIVLGGFSTTQTVWEAGDASTFDFGAHYFVKNLIGGWTRVWVTHRLNTATLYANLSNYSHAGVVDSFRIPDQSHIDFLDALAPSDYLGGSITGGTTFTHPAEFVMKFVMVYATATYGVIWFRYVDADNRYFIDFTGGAIRLFRRVAATNTQLATAAVLSNGVTYSITMFSRGRHIRVYVNGTLQLSSDGALWFDSATDGTVSQVTGGIRDLAVWEMFPSGAAATLLDTATDLTTPGTQIDINGYTILGINPAAYRWASLATVDIGGTDYQAACWWESERNLVIAKRTLPAGGWTLYKYDGVNVGTTITLATDDNHNVCVIGIDPNGILHVCYDMHTEALNYRKGNAALSTWTGTLGSEISMVGTNETNVSYPCFFNDPPGTLYFMFRDGDSGDSDWYMYTYDEGAGTWAAAAGTGTGGLLLNGKVNPYGVYLNGPPAFDTDFGAGGFMHVSWHWRTGSELNEDPSYVKWDGTDWFQSGGGAQTVPITKANCEVIENIANTVGLTSFNGIAADDDGNPHVVYPRNDGSGFVQIWHFWHNGTAWQSPQALTSNTSIASGGDGGGAPQAVTIACNQGTGEVFVIFNGRSYEEGHGLYAYSSTDYSTWVKETIDAGELGNWRPSYDRGNWAENGKLQFLYALGDIRLIDWTP